MRFRHPCTGGGTFLFYPRDGGDKGAGVVGLGMGEDVVGTTTLHDAAALHDHYTVGEELDHREVVGDEEVGVVVEPLEVVEEVEHLRLHADIEGRDTLVADDELGLQDKGTGDAGALALSAAELVGVAVIPGGVEAHLLHKISNRMTNISNRMTRNYLIFSNRMTRSNLKIG